MREGSDSGEKKLEATTIDEVKRVVHRSLTRSGGRAEDYTLVGGGGGSPDAGQRQRRGDGGGGGGGGGRGRLPGGRHRRRKHDGLTHPSRFEDAKKSLKRACVRVCAPCVCVLISLSRRAFARLLLVFLNPPVTRQSFRVRAACPKCDDASSLNLFERSPFFIFLSVRERKT
jgi:hypothetical protein